ncbi:hypothetical protein EBR66_06895 [bacterium]|nr:hypothetical protein [bacterium]
MRSSQITLALFRDKAGNLKIKASGLVDRDSGIMGELIDTITIDLSQEPGSVALGEPDLAQRYQTLCGIDAMSHGAISEILELFCRSAISIAGKQKREKKAA